MNWVLKLAKEVDADLVLGNRPGCGPSWCPCERAKTVNIMISQGICPAACSQTMRSARERHVNGSLPADGASD